MKTLKIKIKLTFDFYQKWKVKKKKYPAFQCLLRTWSYTQQYTGHWCPLNKAHRITKVCLFPHLPHKCLVVGTQRLQWVSVHSFMYSYITAYANNLVLTFLPWQSWVVADGSPRVIAQLRSALCVSRLQSGALPETLIMPPTVENVYWFHAQHLTLNSQQIILLDLNTINGVFQWNK